MTAIRLTPQGLLELSNQFADLTQLSVYLTDRPDRVEIESRPSSMRLSGMRSETDLDCQNGQDTSQLMLVAHQPNSKWYAIEALLATASDASVVVRPVDPSPPVLAALSDRLEQFPITVRAWGGYYLYTSSMMSIADLDLMLSRGRHRWPLGDVISQIDPVLLQFVTWRINSHGHRLELVPTGTGFELQAENYGTTEARRLFHNWMQSLEQALRVPPDLSLVEAMDSDTAQNTFSYGPDRYRVTTSSDWSNWVAGPVENPHQDQNDTRLLAIRVAPGQQLPDQLDQQR